MINSVQKYIYEPFVRKEDDKNKNLQDIPSRFLIYIMNLLNFAVRIIRNYELPTDGRCAYGDCNTHEMGVINGGDIYPETLCSINEVIIKMDCVSISQFLV